MLKRYTSGQVTYMNHNYPWSGSLTLGSEKEGPTGLWELHATGDADLNGRKYKALPVGIKITEEMKRKYNLM